MTPADLDRLADEWILGQSAGGVGTPEWDSREQLMLQVMSLPEEAPHLAWRFVLLVIAKSPSEQVLGVLSALILEDLLTAHGPDFIARVAEEAGKSNIFKRLLGQVWLDSEDTPVWREVYEIAEVTPPFPEGWRANKSIESGSPSAPTRLKR